jgi:hypothetical protein
MKACKETRKVSFQQATNLQDLKKIAFWQSSIEKGQFSCFPGAESLSVDSTLKAKFLDSSNRAFLDLSRSEYPAIASKA